MAASVQCGDEIRRQVTAASTFNGIDYVEVASADQRTLEVRFVQPLPGEAGGVPAGPALTVDNVRIDGGIRVVGVEVTSVTAAGSLLTVEVDRAGDFSPYTLRIVADPFSDAPPSKFDPSLSSHEFSFKAACPSPFDCVAPERPAPPLPASPRIDYLAKDFDSFTQLLLDRLNLTSPAWQGRNEADPQYALVHLIADLGDRLSYEQDACGTEAYLGTARSRISLRRHARLLDYRVDDGANASAWVHVEVEAGGPLDGQTLDPGATILTGVAGGTAQVTGASVADELRRGALAFETTSGVALGAEANRILFHTWSDSQCRLLAGATEATLVRPAGLTLAAGDPLLLEEERSPVTGSESDADRARRHVVRLTEAVPGVDPVTATDVYEVAWARADALPFDLTLSARVDEGGAPVDVGVARGNLVVADHGRTVELDETLVVPVSSRPFRPWLPVSDVSMVTDDAGNGRPVIALDDGSGQWDWRPADDLLGASGDDTLFVAEVENDGRVRLRFGDDRHGQRPEPGTAFDVRVRLGSGPPGNVGSEALSRLVTDLPGAVRRVRNPLPASGGRARETHQQIVTRAPSAFRTQERAVTVADWAEVAQRHPEVQRAAATMRWTGSWWTVFVTIDRFGGGSVLDDEVLATELRTFLERFRMAGTDLELRDPVDIAFDLVLHVCVEPGHFRSAVAQAARRALAPGPHADGSTGLFHPDRTTFGDTLYLSQIHEAVEAVPGVASVEIVECHPLGSAPADELATGRIGVGQTEVLRLDDDPTRPENGRLRIEADGGL